LIDTSLRHTPRYGWLRRYCHYATLHCRHGRPAIAATIGCLRHAADTLTTYAITKPAASMPLLPPQEIDAAAPPL